MSIVILTNFRWIYRNSGNILQSQGRSTNSWWPWFSVKEHSKTFWTLTFGLLGRNIAPLHFQSERVPETALLASWFWASLARFAGIRGIFSSPEDSMLTHDKLSFQWYVHRQKERTLGVDLLGRNIAPLHFRTERVPETALRPWWFWATLARSARIWETFSSPKDSKLTPDGLRCQWNWHR